MTIHILEANCGAGKTYQTLHHIAKNPGKYVFAVNKIDLIAERIREFQAFEGSHHFEIHQLHSRFPTTIGPTVGSSIQTFTNHIGSRAQAVLLFVTHESLKIADWTNYQDWHLIIDEVPAVWSYLERNFSQSGEYLRQYFDAEPYEGLQSYSRLSLTRAGRDLRNGYTGDDLVRVLKPLLDNCSRSEVVLVNTAAWEDTARRKFKAFCLFEPLHLEHFRSVTILGNRIQDSLLYRCWQSLGVQFKRSPIPIEREPIMPVGERLQVTYFSRRPATFSFFRDEQDPLRQIADWCRKRLGKTDAYYTTNDEFLQNFRFDGQARISPMAHGHNHLKDKTVGMFMAAMKGKPHEYATVKDAFGVTREEFDQAREYEALYQFVMRSNLRVYDSQRPVRMYVFSQQQADYLQRVTGCDIAFEDIGINDAVNKGGRPVKCK